MKLVTCVCGNVEIKTRGEPLLSVACHCHDCHEGSRRIEALPKAPAILDSYGGTPHLLYRKDRFDFSKGKEMVKSIKVDEDSPSRVYASCCNSYLYMDLPSPMQWAPISRQRFKGEVRPIEMRINAKFKAGSADAPKDVPFYSAVPFKFVRKLLGSWIAMKFGR